MNDRQLTKPGNLEHTVQPVVCSASWRVSLPSDTVGLTLFRTASSLFLGVPGSLGVFLVACLSLSVKDSAFIAYSGRERSVSGTSCFGLFTFLFKELPARCNASISEVSVIRSVMSHF